VLGDIGRVAVELAKSAALAVGPLRARHTQSRLIRGYIAEKSSPDYVVAVYEEHRARAGRAISGQVLELGPGGNLGVASLFVAGGAASATCIDVEEWVRDAPELYSALGIDGRTLARVKYETPLAAEDASFPDGSFELIYSQSALQHMHDPARVIANIWRMLQPGGRTSHWIDLSDLGNQRDPLQFLRYRDWQWRLMSSHRIMGLNRWRASDFEAAFADAGFIDVSIEANQVIEVTETQRVGFAPRFHTKPLTDLARLGIWLSAGKPDEAGARD
jgi:SAM-dependent methyltransferase